MKRFIDLRGQGTGARFAWWDTGVDHFESHSDQQAWITWEDFRADYDGNEADRYRSLCPPWVFLPCSDDRELE